MNTNKENSNWLRVSLYYARKDWHTLLPNISAFAERVSEEDIPNHIILFSQEKGENVRLAVSATDSEKENNLRCLIDSHFTSFISDNKSVLNKEFEYGKTLWCNYENNSIVWDTYDIVTATTAETEYLRKTSSVISGLLENDFSSDNFYSVALYLLSKILKSIASAKRIDTVERVIETYSTEFAQFGEYDFATSDLINQFQISLSDVFEAIHAYWEENEVEDFCLNEWINLAAEMVEDKFSPYTLIDNIFYVLGLSLMERLFILEIVHKWLKNRN